LNTFREKRGYTFVSFEEFFFGFLIALAAGALIGLERQQNMLTTRPSSIGGVRTFPLIALLGALSALLSHVMGVWAILGTFLFIGGVLMVAYLKEWKQDVAPGMTTPIAAVITFLLGVLALLPDLPLDTIHRYLLIIASASVVMGLLSFKEPLHKAISHVSDADIYATAKFVILALVVLPLLPNETYGPLNVLNPFHIGLMVVFIAAISFLGYVASGLVGPRRGLVTTGIVGGLVSSTAVTISVATHVRKNPTTVQLGAVAILAASSMMFLRMMIVVGVLNTQLLMGLLWPLIVMMMVGWGITGIWYEQTRSSTADTTSVTPRNPFELRSALQFGLLYGVVLFVAKAAQSWLGDTGLYVSSILAGMTDVDAITLSMIQFHLRGLSTDTATMAITLAAMTNMIVKAGMASWGGGKSLAYYVGTGTALVLFCGGAVILVGL